MGVAAELFAAAALMLGTLDATFDADADPAPGNIVMLREGNVTSRAASALVSHQ